MKKTIFVEIAVVIFFLLPTLLGRLGGNENETQLIAGVVIYLEMLFLFLFVLLQRNHIIEMLTKTHPEYSANRTMVIGTIIESHVERIKFKESYGYGMHWHKRYSRDAEPYNELVLRISYQWEETKKK